MKQYRTSLQIEIELLRAVQNAGQDGINTINLLMKSNLSMARLKRYSLSLMKSNLIKQETVGNQKIYKLEIKNEATK